MTYETILQAWGGNASSLARELGLTRAAVAIWKKRGIPAERIPEVIAAISRRNQQSTDILSVEGTKLVEQRKAQLLAELARLG